MKKALAIAGILALSIKPKASFADHLEPNESELRPSGNLDHTNLSGANLTGARLDRADLGDARLDGITATNLTGCPSSLPSGRVCENNSLIQR